MTIEERRESLQTLLDSQKTAKERNILGQFSTPFPLACEIVRHIGRTTVIPHPIHFLEPSIGTGAFYSALLSTGIKPETAQGYEIDPHYSSPSKKLWADSPIQIDTADFLSLEPIKKFNLIIANPPYSRHHHIDSLKKREFAARIDNNYGIRISGLAGLYCYFMILSTLWLEDDGVSAWLVPSEFMDVNYGKALRTFLTEKVELLSIHKFDADDLQFSDALVSSCVVVFRNSKPSVHNVIMTNGSSLESPQSFHQSSLEDLRASDKWSHFFTHTYNDNTHDDNTHDDNTHGVPLKTYFNVSRGISTGNNSFFIINKELADKFDLPADMLTPILPSPRHLKTDIITDEGLKEYGLYLFSSSYPLEYIRDHYPNAYTYITKAQEEGLCDSYNCRRRKPWYSTEKRAIAPFYITYMGRGEGNGRMFRFILNHTNATVSNSYLILYPKPEFIADFNKKNVKQAVWSLLCAIPKDEIIKCGRCYGGGLYKIEPKELLNVTIPSLDHLFEFAPRSLFDL